MIKYEKEKNACIIQARTGSSRFPNKVISKIKDKTILEHVLDFLKFSELTDQIIIATTELSEDDIIEKIGIKNNVKVFRGSESDVLSRYYFCAKQFDIDIIIRITADNPLIDPKLVDKVIDEIQTNDLDYASNMIYQTYPLGYLVEAFTQNILEKIHKLTDSKNREHVTPYLRENYKKFKTKNITTPAGLERNTWRLTLDYEDDLKLIKKIFDEIYQNGTYIPYELVVKFLDSNKSLLEINSKLK